MNKTFLLLSLLLLFVNCKKPSVQPIVEAINLEFTGVVADKYNRVSGQLPVLEIQTTTNKKISVVNNQSLVAVAAIGDSIIKVKNDNKVHVKKPNGYELSLFYVEIPEYIREHPDFPKEWQHKWPEATFNLH